MKLYFEKNGFATIKNDYKLPEDSRKMLLKNYIKRMTLNGQTENRDKILEKWEKSLAKSRTEKVSEWREKNERIFINSTHSKTV